MDGFTGFNPQMARGSILETYDDLRVVYTLMGNITSDFFKELSENWASPRAVEFGVKYGKVMNDLLEELLTYRASFAQKAIDAYNNYASVNGAPTFYDNIGGGIAYISDFVESGGDLVSYTKGVDFNQVSGFFKEELNGVVGINVKNATDVVTDLANFGNNILTGNGSYGMTGLNQIDLSIAFYDPSGEVAANYKSMLESLINKIDESYNSMVSDIRTAIETEVDNIKSAASQSASSLMG